MRRDTDVSGDSGASQIVQRVKALVVDPNDLSLIPGTYVVEDNGLLQPGV